MNELFFQIYRGNHARARCVIDTQLWTTMAGLQILRNLDIGVRVIYVHQS